MTTENHFEINVKLYMYPILENSIYENTNF